MKDLVETKKTGLPEWADRLTKDWKGERIEFPMFAWPGGYPFYYVAEDGGVFCPNCVNGKNGSECIVVDDGCQSGWLVIGVDVHYEGEALRCCHCEKEIESAYGNPDDNEKGE